MLVKLTTGQLLVQSYVEAVGRPEPDLPWHKTLIIKYRNFIAIFIPWIVLIICW